MKSLCDDWSIIIIGDRKTPEDWRLDGVNFVSYQQQMASTSQFSKNCPINHYARKNIGYILAIQGGADLIAETDDDNIPSGSFFSGIDKQVIGKGTTKKGWINPYQYFSQEPIWPRGFPLEMLNATKDPWQSDLFISKSDCPIQQYLVDGDPDVDAVYRMTQGKLIKFEQKEPLIYKNNWAPFNSQSTVWWPEAYPLLYLPAYVSFRMTDIWRSFVAQVCLYAAGWSLAFLPPVMIQERNIHSLLHDFEQEVPGYLYNNRIMELLTGLPLSTSLHDVFNNMKLCYEALVIEKLVPEKELDLLDLWGSEIK